MKNDIGYFYDINPTLDMNFFGELFLLSIALNDKELIYNPNKEEIYAYLPKDYKECIEKIMYSKDTDWPFDFAKFINITFYYENQSDWEWAFSQIIQEYLEKNDKKHHYDFLLDAIVIPFKRHEIVSALKKYDRASIQAMDHFARLVLNFAKSRHMELTQKEAERTRKRDYIRVNKTKFSNSYDYE